MKTWVDSLVCIVSSVDTYRCSMLLDLKILHTGKNVTHKLLECLKSVTKQHLITVLNIFFFILLLTCLAL